MHRAIIPITLGASLFAAAMLWADASTALTAVTANVSGAPEPVRIEILRWSTDDEQTRLVNAWEQKPGTGAATAKGTGKQGKAGGKGAGIAKGPAGAKGGGAAPDAALARAVQEAATVGYLWTSEIAGYALRYAGRTVSPDGSQRIVLITQRRLGAVSQRWNPSFEAAPNTYEFSVIELHLNPKGQGEGKVSVVGKLAAPAGIVTLENYDALPVVLRDVKTKAPQP